MRRVNPLYIFIGLNILIFLFGDWIVGEESARELAGRIDGFVGRLGWIGYVGIVVVYAVSAFFFVPILIALNVVSGALFGPIIGTGVSLVGITLGAVASMWSVRYVFTGMQAQIDKRPYAQNVLRQIGQHGAIVVLMVRLAFIVPYLLQNIALALAPIRVHRVALLTAIGALPGAAVYSFLGAGLMRSAEVEELAFYLAIPLVVLLAVFGVMKYLNAKYQVL